MITIEIFKAGRHVALDGSTVVFGERELAEVVRGYDPKIHEAPLVIGHPATNGPAHGWVKSLRASGGSLEANPDQIDPAFAESVRKGHYKKISCSFYRPDSPQNPTPGRWYLRHVGFLGAAPPAVKGLRPVELAGDASGYVEFAQLDAGAFLTALRTLIVEQLGAEVVDAALGPAPSAEAEAAPMEAAEIDEVAFATALRELVVEQLGDAAGNALAGSSEEPEEEPAPEPAPAPATPPAPAELSEPERRRRAELERRERELDARERATARRDHVQFLDALVQRGKPLPCKRDLIVSFMEGLEQVDQKTARELVAANFGESEKRSLVELFKGELLARLPKQVELAEVGAPGAAIDSSDAAAIAARASAYRDAERAKGHIVSTSEAVRHVRGQRA